MAGNQSAFLITIRFGFTLARVSRMVQLFRTLCAIVRNLLLVRCSSLTSKSLQQEKVKVNCFEQDWNDFFLEVESLASLREVHLEGFLFSEENLGEFSRNPKDWPSSLESFTILNCYCGDESE